MAEQDNGGTNNSDGATKRVVRATIASAASALIAYAIRKAAPLVRDKIQSLDGSVPETLGKAKDAVGEKVEAATSVVTDRFGSGSDSGSDSDSDSGSDSGSGSGSGSRTSTATKATTKATKVSGNDLEKRHSERARHRAERQKALTS